MKSAQLLLVCGISFCFLNAWTYPAMERMVESMIQERTLDAMPIPIEYEKNSQGNDSMVEIVKGLEQFGRRVLSGKLAVVVKIVIEDGHYSRRLKRVFQNVATRLHNNVRFVSLNVSYNKEVIERIALLLKLETLQFPMILFFENGFLRLPIISGFVGKRELCKKIESYFPSFKGNALPM